MRRITGMFVCISLLLNLSFTSYASERLIHSEGNEYQEILSMKDEVLYHINYGGARGELNRDVEADEVEMERAYKVYANSELLKTNDVKESLENSYYKWQIPVYTDGFTILVDITKVISIPADIPEDAKETLKQKLNIWTVGAVYVYDAETVDYDNTVTTSLEEAGYNSDEYSYEVVSGLSGIRYPAAIIFNADEKPEFVIPAQKSTTHAFIGEWPTAAKNREKTATPLNAQNSNNDNINGFSIYYYDDVVRVSNSYNQSGVGLSYKKDIIEKNTIAVSIFGAAGILLIIGTKKEIRKG
ncbi:hypothetical protein HMPREF9472_03711 [Enterocloster bolteae WAL-14578]|nr:hypothetical protein HMPREF9472_03711 [Enterocloster bolteae WAL-14578]